LEIAESRERRFYFVGFEVDLDASPSYTIDVTRML